MRRMKRRSRSRASLALVVSALWLAATGLPQPCVAAKKPKFTPEAVLGGTVFQENGFSLRGARVVVYYEGHPKDRREAITDMQGEFAVRVPAGKARYTVEVSAQGFTSDKKTVEVTGDERIDLTFRLARVAK